MNTMNKPMTYSEAAKLAYDTGYLTITRNRPDWNVCNAFLMLTPQHIMLHCDLFNDSVEWNPSLNDSIATDWVLYTK